MLPRFGVCCVAAVSILTGCAIPTNASRTDAPTTATDTTPREPPQSSSAAQQTPESTTASTSPDGAVAVDFDDLGLSVDLPSGFEPSEPEPGSRLTYLAVRKSTPPMSFGLMPCPECADLDLDEFKDWDFVNDTVAEVTVDGFPGFEAFGVDTGQVLLPVGNMLIVLRGEDSFMITMVGVEDFEPEWRTVVDSVSIDDS